MKSRKKKPKVLRSFRVLSGYEYFVDKVIFFREYNYILILDTTTSHTIRKWDVRTRKCIGELKIRTETNENDRINWKGAEQIMKWNEDGDFLICASDGSMKIYSIHSLEEKNSFPQPKLDTKENIVLFVSKHFQISQNEIFVFCCDSLDHFFESDQSIDKFYYFVLGLNGKVRRLEIDTSEFKTKTKSKDIINQKLLFPRGMSKKYEKHMFISDTYGSHTYKEIIILLNVHSSEIVRSYDFKYIGNYISQTNQEILVCRGNDRGSTRGRIYFVDVESGNPIKIFPPGLVKDSSAGYLVRGIGGGSGSLFLCYTTFGTRRLVLHNLQIPQQQEEERSGNDEEIEKKELGEILFSGSSDPNILTQNWHICFLDYFSSEKEKGEIRFIYVQNEGRVRVIGIPVPDYFWVDEKIGNNDEEKDLKEREKYILGKVLMEESVSVFRICMPNSWSIKIFRFLI